MVTGFYLVIGRFYYLTNGFNFMIGGFYAMIDSFYALFKGFYYLIGGFYVTIACLYVLFKGLDDYFGYYGLVFYNYLSYFYGFPTVSQTCTISSF